MNLLIRYDPISRVLRSVGDAPNGIVCMGAPDNGAAWLIEGSYEPDPAALGRAIRDGVGIDSRPGEGGLGPASTVVEAADLVAGLHSDLEARGLLAMMFAMLRQAVEQHGRDGEFERIPPYCQLAVETRDALAVAGYLSRGGAS